MMRVLHCIPSMEGGGAERQLTYLAGALVASGCDVHVALVGRGPNFERLEATGAAIHELGPCGSHDPRLFSRLLRTIRRVRPDIVQCWLLQMEVLGGAASLVTGIPWIFSERSSADAYPRTLKTRVRVAVASFANAIVANSEGGRAYWEGKAPKSVCRYVIQNGLPLEEISEAPPDSSLADGQTNGALIVFSGRLDAGKNAATFVDAIGQVSSAIPVQALICGDGPLRSAIEEAIAARGLTGRVRVVGFARNFWGLLKRSRVFVSPSRFEGSPNAVLEAMACRCPIVVSDIPAHREILDDESAVFVRGDDSAALARALTNVLADQGAAVRRAERALERVAVHALPVVARRYLEVYDNVLTRCARSQVAV